MGSNAAIWGPAVASAVGPALAAAFAPDGQERESFAGTNMAPLRMMNQANDFTRNLGTALAGRVATGVNLPSAYVQQPGTYSGGGLPMPIGLVASDPALGNRSLQSLQGLGAFQNLWGVPGGTPTGDGWYDPVAPGGDNPVPPGAGLNPTDGFDPDTGAPIPGFGDFYLPPFDQRSNENPQGTTDGLEPRPGNWAESRSEGSGTRRVSAVGANDGEYGQLVRASDLMAGGEDDLSQALGSVELLLEAFGGRR